MRHEAKSSSAPALLISACLLFTTGIVRAQTSLQQALLRSALPAPTAAEDTAPAPSTSVAAALQQVANQAAIAFTGSVTKVGADSSGGARVTFAVEQGVRGVASGAMYTMHVSGWAGGAERFHRGERGLFLLTAPSLAGYSAPVMGERGIIPLTGDALVGNLDLRWVATDVQRGTAAPQDSPVPISGSSPQFTAAVSAPTPLFGSSANRTSIEAPGTITLPDVHSIDRDLILDLLRSGNITSAEGR